MTLSIIIATLHKDSERNLFQNESSYFSKHLYLATGPFSQTFHNGHLEQSQVISCTSPQSSIETKENNKPLSRVKNPEKGQGQVRNRLLTQTENLWFPGISLKIPSP